MDKSKIHCWEFNYYSTDLEEWTECTYYTFMDKPDLAILVFKDDEKTNDYDCCLEDVITPEEMVQNFGDMNLVLENNLELEAG